MASPTITFPCPFCGRRMGVTAEFLGRQVRCPHCKQVVLAPSGSAPAPVAPQPAVPTPAPVVPRPASHPAPVIQIVSPPNPQPAAMPPPPEPELPVFNIPQRKEGADSILSEPDESDDEVFGSHPGMRMGAMPPLETIPSQPGAAPPEAARPEQRNATGAATPPTSLPPVPPAAPTGSHSTSPASQLPPPTGPTPLADLEPVSLPSAFVQPVPAPAPAPPPQAVAPAPAPAAPSNPFADFGTDASPPAAPPERERDEERSDEERPRKKKKRDRDDREEHERDRDERPAREGRARPAAPGSGGGVMAVLVILLAGYALLATAAAVYGLFFRGGGQPDTGHPLSTIPDNFGEFDPASRKKVSQYKFKVDGELPADQRAGLGEKIAIGQLEIQPVRIEKRRLVIKTEGAREERQRVTGPALVLTLAIKNTSSDLYIHPMDPAFTRKALGYDTPITRLVVNKDTVFAGGEIQWPPSGNVKRQLEVQQANDYVPLKPGERREYVVFTSAESKVVRAAEAAKEPLQWRVQVRRGPVEYKGKEIPVTAVIGVDFKASEITTPD